MARAGVAVGGLNAASYYLAGDTYNAGRAVWTTAGSYVGGWGGAALFSPSGPGAFVGGAGGSIFGGWISGKAYDFFYGGN